MRIKLAEDIITKEDIAQLTNWMISTDHYTKGEQTICFEKEWSDWLGSKYSVFVNSGSSANLLMFLSLLHSGRLKNNKVIVPAVGWATTVSPAIQLGYDPVLCDCDPDDLGYSVEDFEYLCKKYNPSCAILVHVLGHSNKMQQIIEICKKYNVVLLEDTCEAPGSELGGKKLGTYGLASSFSFFYGHQMSTIEGGMVCTDDRELYNIMLSIRSHGWLRDNEPYFKQKYMKKYEVSDFESQYFFVFPGLNIRSTDINAFIGRLQVEKMNEYVNLRNKNFNKYKLLLSDSVWTQESKSNLISSLGFGIISDRRKHITEQLVKSGVECRPLVCGSIQEHPFWFEKYEKRNLPNATLVHKNGFYVPCHQQLNHEQVEFICQIILKNL